MLTLPNLLTLLRLILVPLIAYLLVQGKFLPAFICFLIAGFSDLLDGIFARLLGQRSPFGAWLDPAADKVLIVIIFALLTGLGHVPHWLFLIVTARDILIVTAVAELYLAGKEPVMRPIMVSKLTTVAQVTYLAMVLASLAFTTPFDSLVDVAGYATAALTGLSFLAYFRLWLDYRRTNAQNE